MYDVRGWGTGQKRASWWDAGRRPMMRATHIRRRTKRTAMEMYEPQKRRLTRLLNRALLPRVQQTRGNDVRTTCTPARAVP